MIESLPRREREVFEVLCGLEASEGGGLDPQSRNDGRQQGQGQDDHHAEPQQGHALGRRTGSQQGRGGEDGGGDHPGLPRQVEQDGGAHSPRSRA